MIAVPKTNMLPAWQFISSQADGSVSNPEARKLVRENAMRSFRRRQRLQRVRQFQQKQARIENGHGEPSQTDPQVLVASEASCVMDMEGKVLEEQRCDEAHALHKRTAFPGSGPGDALDPFHTTAMYSHHDARLLFMCFIREIAPKLQPFGVYGHGHPVVTLWPWYAMQDATILQSLLFHAAVYVDSRNCRPWTALTWYHRGRCIRLVNQQLALNGNHLASDFVIGAVGLIGATGNITGDVDQDLVHRVALQRMVEMRGGLETLGSHGILATVLPIGDLISSAISDSTPILEHSNLDVAAAILGLELPKPFARPATHSLSLNAFRFEICTLISFIGKLGALHSSSIHTLIASTGNMIAFSQLCYGIEHRLLSIRSHNSNDWDPPLRVYEVARIAGIMCMTYLFRQMDLAGMIFVNLQKRLHTIINDIESSSAAFMDHDTTRIFLWALSVGSLTALDKSWLIRRIGKLVSSLAIKNLHELSECLSCFVWTSTMAQDFLKILVI